MLTSQWDNIILDEWTSPVLRAAGLAWRKHQATPRMRAAALNASLLSWRPAGDLLPDPPPPGPPTRDDWQWAARHPSLFNQASLPATAAMLAEQYVHQGMTVGVGGAKALALAQAARIARLDPDVWRLSWIQAGLKTNCPPTPRLLGLESSLPLWVGERTACAISMLALEDAWRADHAISPTGQQITIPREAWDTVEQLGLKPTPTGA